MGFAGSTDKVDDLVVSVTGDVASVDKYDLVTLVKLGITPMRHNKVEKQLQ